MEEDRAQTDLGIAADIEEAQAQAQAETNPTPVQRQPKKRFVGRKTAARSNVTESSVKDRTVAQSSCSSTPS